MREYRMVFYGFIMIFMMIVRPQGILDRRLFQFRKRESFRIVMLVRFEGVTKSFGGMNVLNHVSLEIEGGKDPRLDRAERRGKDNPL